MDEKKDTTMRNITLEELLEAGCHFGHQVSRQNPQAKEYIFEARDGIHIIDLEKTKEGLDEAAAYIKTVAQRDGTMLVLGTKRQAEAVLNEEKKRLGEAGLAGMYFVTKRWIGGTLTNFSEVAKNYKKLKDLTEKLQDKKERAKYTKKELSGWDKDRIKLEGFYGGTADMKSLPDVIFIIDSHQEHVAAGESLKARIPTVGITDTNADPTVISYPIPANDDAVGSLKLIISHIFDAWVEGKKEIIKAEPKKENDEDKKDDAKKEVKEASPKKEEVAKPKKPAKKVEEKKK